MPMDDDTNILTISTFLDCSILEKLPFFFFELITGHLELFLLCNV